MWKYLHLNNMKSKKAVVGIQFNWMFVLIAGAVILVFFSTIVVRQKEQSEIKTSGIVLTDLEAILTGAKVSTKAATSIDIPPLEIKFSCDSYSIGAVKKQIKTMTLFTPNRIKGRKLITWALDWNVPFTVTNFLYATSPEVRYIFVQKQQEDDTADIIYDMIPTETDPLKPKINKEKAINPNANTIQDKNNYKVKFVYFKGNPSAAVLNKIKDMDDEDVRAVKIEPGDTDDTGTIKFYEKNGDAWSGGESSPYLTYTSLIGAIFAEDKETYDCVMGKEFEKYKIMVDIYKHKSDKLNDNDMYGNSECGNLHTDVAGILDSLSTILSGTIDVSSIKSNIVSLELKNKDLQSKSCVMVY